jgi:hypothetical protein
MEFLKMRQTNNNNNEYEDMPEDLSIIHQGETSYSMTSTTNKAPAD